MSSIIDISYFKGDILIPQVSTPAITEAVNRYISIYEPEYLQNVLGYKMSRDFIAGLAVVSPAVVDPKWIDLRDGKEFTDPVTNRLTKWRGFKNTAQLSPIANYIYYMYRKDNVTQTGGIGETITQAENSVVVSPARKMTLAWNQQVAWTKILWNFLFANMTTYGLTSADFGPYPSNPLAQYPIDADIFSMYTINDFDA